ncbi:MAG: hypothetical protein EOM73_04410 [Bacteroidia bacterium]|nr:hypothetical protein [Bacteroidia bacterium]
MKSFVLLLLFFTWFTTHPISSAPKVILKLDDLSAENGVCRCIPTFDFLMNKQIKAGFGAIASRFDNTALNILKPYLDAKNVKGEPLFEIWHHGLDHVKPEFSGTTYEYQKSHFEEADKQIKQLLEIQMVSFGTPYNASDSVTNRVISENTNYKVFMFASQNPTRENGMLYINNRVNIEKGTGNPDYLFFIENYTDRKEKYSDYIILQAHPNDWTPEKLEEFSKIIDFLLLEGCEFILPNEYYKMSATQ